MSDEDEDDDEWLDEAASTGGLACAPSGARERVIRQVCEQLAPAPVAVAAAAADVGRRAAHPPAQTGPTLRSLPAYVAEGANDVARADAAAVVDMPQVQRAPAFLTSTGRADELTAEQWRERGELPFKPVPGWQPPARRAPMTVQSRARGIEPGKTAPLDEAIVKAAAEVLRFGDEVPALTLRRYASMRAELALTPERAGAIWEQYQVREEAARAALDAYWWGKMAARPEVRAAFVADFGAYTGWLRSQGA